MLFPYQIYGSRRFCVRHASLSILSLHAPGRLQVLYVVMMYISAYPVVITMRNSNVYEERSLGIFAEDEDNSNEHVDTKMPPAGVGRLPRIKKKLTGMTAAPQREHRSYFVRQQLRAQLAHDAWWIALAVFLIMIIENSQFDANPTVFSVFNVIFEVVRYITLHLASSGIASS